MFAPVNIFPLSANAVPVCSTIEIPGTSLLSNNHKPFQQFYSVRIVLRNSPEPYSILRPLFRRAIKGV